jgi:hypothetical protein
MKHLTKTIGILLFVGISTIYSQNYGLVKSSSLSISNSQIKESANFGFVFKGGGFSYEINRSWTNDKRMITYENDFGVDILSSHGIGALGFNLKPIDIGYLFKLPVSQNSIYIGPTLKGEYNYFLYPDLQSGFDYWFTNYSLGFRSVFDVNLQRSNFQIKLNTSLLGLSSRQPAYRDPYFFDLGVGFALEHLHQNLTFGSLNSYNTSNMEIIWRPKQNSKLSFGYALTYKGYYGSPQISMFNQTFKLIFNK